MQSEQENSAQQVVPQDPQEEMIAPKGPMNVVIPQKNTYTPISDDTPCSLQSPSEEA